jgi:hypothetical protein
LGLSFLFSVRLRKDEDKDKGENEDSNQSMRIAKAVGRNRVDLKYMVI